MDGLVGIIICVWIALTLNDINSTLFKILRQLKKLNSASPAVVDDDDAE